MAGPTKKPLPSGASAVYEAVTSEVSLHAAILAAFAAGPDQDINNWHPDNSGSLSITEDGADLVVSCSLTGNTADGWDEGLAMKLGTVTTLLGTAYDPSEHVLVLRGRCIDGGTYPGANTAKLIVAVQQSLDGAIPDSSEVAPGVGFVRYYESISTLSDDVRAVLGVASANMGALPSEALTPPDVRAGSRVARRPSDNFRGLIRGADDGSAMSVNPAVAVTANPTAATSSLWMHVGKAYSNTGQVTAAKYRFTAQLLKPLNDDVWPF